MMNTVEIRLKKKACEMYGLTLEEALILVTFDTVPQFMKLKDELVKKGLLSLKRDGDDEWFLPDKACNIVHDILLESETIKKRDLGPLCKRLKEIYPRGCKEVSGKRYYWTDSVKLIERRLKTFFSLYGEFSDEEIEEATERYVKSFEGNYDMMKLLKYFIFREKSFGGGVSEPSSDLLNFIENKDERIVTHLDRLR